MIKQQLKPAHNTSLVKLILTRKNRDATFF